MNIPLDSRRKEQDKMPIRKELTALTCPIALHWGGVCMDSRASMWDQGSG